MDPKVTEARTLAERLMALVEEIPRPFLGPLFGMVLLTLQRGSIRMMRPSSGAFVPWTVEGEWRGGDRLLDTKQVASLLGVSVNWVSERSNPDHAEYLPCTRRLSPRKLRYSESVLRKWMRER